MSGVAKRSAGRWVGYLSYDLGRLFERLPERAGDELGLPLFVFSYHGPVEQRLEGRGVPGGLRAQPEPLAGSRPFRSLLPRGRGDERRTSNVEHPTSSESNVLEASSAVLGAVGERPPHPPLAPEYRGEGSCGGLSSNFSRARYEGAVGRAVEYIRAGDVFQVNLSQRFSAGLRERPR